MEVKCVLIDEIQLKLKFKRTKYPLNQFVYI